MNYHRLQIFKMFDWNNPVVNSALFVEMGSVMNYILSSKMSEMDTGECIYISTPTTVKHCIIFIDGSVFLYFTHYDFNQWFDASLTNTIEN